MSTHRHQTDLPQLEEPVRASPKDTNSRRKTKLAELDEEEKEELRTLKADHRDNMKLIYTFKCTTTYDVLVSLKQRIAPTDSARKLRLATQYARLKKAPRNQNFEVWLQEWETVYTECKELDLPEVNGDRLVKDFAYAVESSSNWSKYTETTVVRSSPRRAKPHKDPSESPLRTNRRIRSLNQSLNRHQMSRRRKGDRRRSAFAENDTTTTSAGTS